MRTRGLLLGTALTVLAPLETSFADDLSDALREEILKFAGTMSVHAQPDIVEGKLNGCSLLFEAVQQDWKYLQGNFVKVSGTAAIMTSNGSLGVALKLVAAELDPSLPNLGGAALPVSRVYLVGADGLSTNFDSLVNSMETNNQGRLAIYAYDPGLTMLLSGVTSNQLTVGFALGGGSSDILLPLQIDVVDVDSEGNRMTDVATSLSYLDCTKRVLEMLQ